MPFKRIPLPLLALLFVAFLSVPGTATTYNPYTQFSLTSNPNGVWTYGYGSVGSGPITLFTSTSGQSWTYNNTDPVIGNENGSYNFGGQNIPNGDLVMHPGNVDTLASILVFTAPTSGTYSLNGLFERDDTHDGLGNGVVVSICQDTTNCSLFSQTISSSRYLNNAQFNLSRTLTAGETLDFEVAENYSYYYDTTGLQLNITSTAGASPIPEPSSLMLLGTGVAALFGVAKRQMRKRAVCL